MTKQEVCFCPSNQGFEMVSPDGEVVLKQLSSEDAVELFNLVYSNRTHLSINDGVVVEIFSTLEATKQEIENSANSNRLRFAIRNKQEILVGSINITNSWNLPGWGEIGFFLAEKYQGKGYASRALDLITRFGFEKELYFGLFGDVLEENRQSSDVFLREGYQGTARLNGIIRYCKGLNISLSTTS